MNILIGVIAYLSWLAWQVNWEGIKYELIVALDLEIIINFLGLIIYIIVIVWFLSDAGI